MEKKENSQSKKNITNIGILLKTAREKKGLSLESITNVLCIRLRHLKAIEESNYEELPGKTYAIGFVKSYSEHLDLDGDEIVRLFKEEVAELKKKQEFYNLETGAEASVSSYSTVFIFIFLAFLVYLGWNYSSDSERKNIEIIDDIPKKIEEVIKNQKEIPKLPEDETLLKEAKQVEQKEITEPIKVETTTIEKEIIEPIKEEIEMNEEKVEEEITEPVKEETVVETSEEKIEEEILQTTQEPSEELTEKIIEKEHVPQIYGQGNTTSRVTIKTNIDSWVHVVGTRETGEEIIFISKLFYKNDIYHLPNRIDLFLDTGNAGGLDLFVDGLKVESLGKMGAVKRKISLSPNELLKKVTDTKLNQN